MSVAETPLPPRRAVTAPTGPILPDVVRSEATKFRTVRSTYWTIVAAVVAIVGLGALLCATYIGHYSHIRPEERATFDPTSFSLSGLLLAQLAIGVLGVLLITSEYSTGMIRATLAAVPQRRTVLAAKAAVFAFVTLVIAEASCFAAFLIGQSILSSKHIEASLGDPGVLRAVVGGGLYLTVLGLLALGLGTIIRHSAGAIAALFGLLLVLPGLAHALPQSWQDSINQYLPSNAGQQIYHIRLDPHTLSPWAGLGVFCVYAAVALAVAAVLLQRRDA
jgi:ABC-type transport system involved in multi-copper enzyme maturation permease subunit